MPAVSQAQFRFMKAVEEGDIKKPGLSPEKAKEFTSENHTIKTLPEHVDFKKTKKYFKNNGVK